MLSRFSISGDPLESWLAGKAGINRGQLRFSLAVRIPSFANNNGNDHEDDCRYDTTSG